jgi:ABC-type transport system involved in multi-copper enzyme maturation permease subunit
MHRAERSFVSPVLLVRLLKSELMNRDDFYKLFSELVDMIVLFRLGVVLCTFAAYDVWRENISSDTMIPLFKIPISKFLIIL